MYIHYDGNIPLNCPNFTLKSRRNPCEFFKKDEQAFQKASMINDAYVVLKLDFFGQEIKTNQPRLYPVLQDITDLIQVSFHQPGVRGVSVR